MILDNISNCLLYSNAHVLFKKAFDYLVQKDFKTLPIGKHTIDGEDLFVVLMEYNSEEHAACKLENHKNYIDIQYIVSGEELIGIKTYTGQTPTIPYDESKDIAFYDSEFDSLIKLQAGQFAIFFPHDLHMPCMKSKVISKIRKAVFKVRV